MPSTGLGHGVSAGRPGRPQQRQGEGYLSQTTASSGAATRGAPARKAIPMAVDDTRHLFSPLIDTLPALPHLASLRTYLPTSPPRIGSSHDSQPQFQGYSKWQNVDLQDGKGRCDLLLVSTAECAFRLYRISPSSLPDQPHVEEEAPAPEEIFSLEKIKRDGTTRIGKLAGVKEAKEKEGDEVVSSAQIVDRGELVQEHGPLIFCVTSSAIFRKGVTDLNLVLVALRTGHAVWDVNLGRGRAATVLVSARTVAITLSHPSPSIHLLHPTTLQPFYSIPDLPAAPNSLPTAALAGRLLALVTVDPPRSTGSKGLGTLITAQSTVRSRAASEGPTRPIPARSPNSTSAVMSSAISIGGGVARGVWAGLKMGAQAAQQANTARLAKSAPADAMLSRGFEDDECVSESMEGSAMLDCPAEDGGAGSWIKIIDLGRLPPTEAPISPYETSTARSTQADHIRTVAHFRLPISASSDYLTHTHSLGGSGPTPRNQTIAALSWNSDGTQLFAAPADGRVFHIFQLYPDAPRRRNRETQGDVLHLYELNRGSTAATVEGVLWDPAGRWIGVATERGTIHVYPIHPSGAPAGTWTHLSTKIPNPARLYPLSQVVEASARLRTGHPLHTTTAPAQLYPTAFFFGRWQTDPLHPGTFCQDINVYHPSLHVIELQRLAVKQEAATSPMAVRRASAMIKRGSGISEMMRLRSATAAAGDSGGGSLSVEQGVKARWRVPSGDVEDVLIRPSRVTRSRSLAPLSHPLSHAEIRTYSVNPRILPSSIYLSHQLDLYTAPHLRVDSRYPLVYRNEVEVRPPTEGASFDEPLSTALHTRLESPTRGEIPGLPNGFPGSGGKWKTPIPIRTVAAGVGEGLDRVRHTYAKSQAIRRHRRASEHLSNRLSFEEGTIFASSQGSDRLGLDMDDSSPSSEAVPDSAIAGDEDEEWAEGWEEEYRHAVEIEGEPDDLVLGLMDEEGEDKGVAGVEKGGVAPLAPQGKKRR